MSEEEDLLSNLPSDVLAAVEGENAKSGTATPKEKAESISGTPAGSETPKVPASDENSKDESGAASGPNYAYVVSIQKIVRNTFSCLESRHRIVATLSQQQH